jgi:hypothetical protein
MTRTSLLAAAALVAAVAVSPALAVENSTQDQTSAHSNLGIDLSSAGATDETRLAFFTSMSDTDQTSVRAKCDDKAMQQSFTADETAFCSAIHGSPAK